MLDTYMRVYLCCFFSALAIITLIGVLFVFSFGSLSPLNDFKDKGNRTLLFYLLLGTVITLIIGGAAYYRSYNIIADITPIEGSYMSEFIEGQPFYLYNCALEITYKNGTKEVFPAVDNRQRDNHQYRVKIIDTQPLQMDNTLVTAELHGTRFSFPVTVRTKAKPLNVPQSKEVTTGMTTDEAVSMTEETIQETEIIIIDGHIYRKEN